MIIDIHEFFWSVDGRGICRSACPNESSKRPLHLIEVGTQIVDPDRSCEIVFAAARKQFRHVAEISKAVVDRRRRQHDEVLLSAAEESIQRPVPRVVGIPEGVGLVDDYEAV